MNAADRSELGQVLRERCDTIVDSWYQVTTQTSHVPHCAAKVRQHLAGLAQQAIAFLLVDPTECGRAESTWPSPSILVPGRNLLGALHASLGQLDLELTHAPSPLPYACAPVL
jgi:hypothetical protein